MICPSEHPIKRILPHVGGQGGHDIVKGDAQPLRSITNVLDQQAHM